MAAMRPTLVALAVALASLLAPARARADGPAPELHLTAGVEIEGTSGITSVGFRGQALIGTHLGTGRLRPSIAAGVVLGTGALFVDDPRAATGAVGLGYTSLGPAVQLGLHLHGGDGHEAAFVFATMATLRTTTDARLMLDAVHGVDARNTRGVRAALGVNWAHGVGNLVSTAAADPRHSSGLAAVLLFVLPEQLEVTLERDTGSLREGATFSWGF
jgi:hypothetical protein